MAYIQKNSFYRPDIDGLRAIAVCLVVFFHVFPTILKQGFIGVDIFFVISGYLIGSIILRNLSINKFSFLHFYVRRIIRIFPVLLLVLLTVLIAGYFLLLRNEYQMLGKHIAGGASFAANFVYFFEAGYWDTASSLKPLLHLWSLGVEEQFYIIIPLILAFAWKRKYNVLLIIVIFFILSFGANLFFYYQKQYMLMFYMPFTRFWEIFAGVLLAWHTLFPIQSVQKMGQKIEYFFCKIFKKEFLENENYYLNNFLAMLGFILLMIALKICHQHNFPGHRAVWPVLSAVLIISAGSSAQQAQIAWFNKKILSNKVLVGIGLISYPLYLWHWPLLSFCRIFQGELLPPKEWLFVCFLCILSALILAVLSYCYVEKPIRFGKNDKNRIAGILLILMLSIFTAGIFTCYKGTTLNNLNSIFESPVGNDNTMLEYAPEANTLNIARFKNAYSNKTIAIIGDSHAQADYPGIANKCAELGMNTALFKYRYDSVNTKNGERELVINILKSKTDIKYVFIILRGILYLLGKDLDYNPLKSAHFVENYPAKLQDVVNTLRSLGKHVIIVSENPVFPFSPKDFFRKYSFIKSSDSNALVPWLSKKDVYENQKDYLQMLNEMTGAEIINGLDVFCPNDKCSLFDENGNSLYYDDDHLSVYGSEYLTKNLLAPYLERIAKEK